MTREDESFLNRVFDSVSDPLAVYDGELRVVRVNSALTVLFQTSHEAVKGRRCFDLFYGRESMCEECHVREVFRTGEPRVRERLVQLPDGRLRCYEVHFFPLKNAAGATIQAVEHARDITERQDLDLTGPPATLVTPSREAEIDRLRRRAGEWAVSNGQIVGQGKKMLEVYELIGLVSSSDATVLITGENGTGKELVAQAIHEQSHRSKGPFIVANCSAYSPALLESELFGHEKGAFTGAISQKKGRIERAQAGTLFLDEIGDIAPATQILLLRFLQDHRFERVGGEKTIEANVRVLAATNRDLRHEVRIGRFRDDLYYRLNVIAIHLPPLRERKEDIPLLARHFLKKLNLKEGKNIHAFSSNAMQALMDCDWPGNVRQLENAISHAVILSQGETIQVRHLPRFLREAAGEPVSTSLTENERSLILRVLKESNWNKHDAARRLRVSRSTLYSKIRRYGLEKTKGVAV